MPDFVDRRSIVRTIWGNADVVLLIFAGSAAEFALNRAVDWLFFTGKLPADPIGRLFSTVCYAQDIVFAEESKARQTIARVAAIHGGVERQRGQAIPDWAYRDVLYMLVDYSERAYQLIRRPLTAEEREELYRTFRRVGEGMRVPDLPANYAEWQLDRRRHLARDLVRSPHTNQLFGRYREALGAWRYGLLRQAQALLVPERVRGLLRLPARPGLFYTLWLYRVFERFRLRPLVQRALLPAQYLDQIRQLEREGTT